MDKTLQMVFGTAGGAKVTLTLDAPKDGLTAAEVQAAMQLVVTKNVFTSNSGDLTSAVEARIVSRDTTTLFKG